MIRNLFLASCKYSLFLICVLFSVYNNAQIEIDTISIDIKQNSCSEKAVIYVTGDAILTSNDGFSDNVVIKRYKSKKSLIAKIHPKKTLVQKQVKTIEFSQKLYTSKTKAIDKTVNLKSSTDGSAFLVSDLEIKKTILPQNFQLKIKLMIVAIMLLSFIFIDPLPCSSFFRGGHILIRNSPLNFYRPPPPFPVV